MHRYTVLLSCGNSDGWHANTKAFFWFFTLCASCLCTSSFVAFDFLTTTHTSPTPTRNPASSRPHYPRTTFVGCLSLRLYLIASLTSSFLGRWPQRRRSGTKMRALFEHGLQASPPPSPSPPPPAPFAPPGPAGLHDRWNKRREGKRARTRAHIATHSRLAPSRDVVFVSPFFLPPANIVYSPFITSHTTSVVAR